MLTKLLLVCLGACAYCPVQGQELFCASMYFAVYPPAELDYCGKMEVTCYNVCDTPGLNFVVDRFKQETVGNEDRCEFEGNAIYRQLGCPFNWDAFPSGFASNDNPDKQVCKSLDAGDFWPDCPSSMDMLEWMEERPAPEFEAVYEANKEWICGLCPGLAPAPTSPPPTTPSPTYPPTPRPTLPPTFNPPSLRPSRSPATNHPTVLPTAFPTALPTALATFEAERDDPNWPGSSPKPGTTTRLILNVQYDDYPQEINWEFEEYNGTIVGLVFNDSQAAVASRATAENITAEEEDWIVLEEYVGSDSVGDESKLVSYPMPRLSPGSYYRFSIVDLGLDGDGICCEWGAKGWVTVTSGAGVLWKLAGDQIGSEPTSVEFMVDGNGTVALVPGEDMASMEPPTKQPVSQVSLSVVIQHDDNN